MTRHNLVLLGAIMLVMVVAGLIVSCNLQPAFVRSNAQRDLQAARTAAEELAAFNRMAQHSRIAFTLHDATGNQVSMSAADWPSQAKVIRFLQFGSPPLEHKLIDSRNVFTLMRE
jgi:hypothetical protein